MEAEDWTSFQTAPNSLINSLINLYIIDYEWFIIRYQQIDNHNIIIILKIKELYLYLLDLLPSYDGLQPTRYSRQQR